MGESQNDECPRGQFRGIVEKIVAEIEGRAKEGGINSREIPEIVTQSMGGDELINCYPGMPGYGCCSMAFFISLKLPRNAKGRNHLDCSQALQKIVQHMQGSCIRQTRSAVFISDNWNVVAVNEWKPNLEEIKNNADLEIYLMGGGRPTLMNW